MQQLAPTPASKPSQETAYPRYIDEKYFINNFFVLASISAFANESSDSLTVEQELADIKLHHKSLLESFALWAKEDQVE